MFGHVATATYIYSSVYVAICINILLLLTEIEKCPTLSDPDNGKVFIISNGRIAIFTCNSGFVTVGNSFVQCINGIWSSPSPKCKAS